MISSRTLVAVGVAAIAALGVSIYATSLSYPFVYDDASSITLNPGIRWNASDGSSWDRLRLLQPTPRPVANLSFALNYAAGGLDVAGYRAVNIAVHVLASLGVALFSWLGIGALARRASPDAGPTAPQVRARLGFALFAGLLFVSHPLATQSVTYVVQRMTSLSTLFYIAALCLWLAGNQFAGNPLSGKQASVNPAGRSLRRWAWRGAAVGAWLLAMGSKEIAATWPIAIWLWEWQVEREGEASRIFARRSVPWALGFAGVGAVVVWAYAGGDPLADYRRKSFTLGERLWTEPRVWWSYVSLVLAPLPSRLSVIHDVEMSRGLLHPWTTAVAIGGWLVALVWAVRSWPQRPALAVVVPWWLLQQLVEGTVLPLEPMYEHRTYLPLVGVCAFAPWGVWSALGDGARARFGVAATAVGLAVVAALTTATVVRNEVWVSAETLWRDALEKSPAHPRPNTNLGMALAFQQRNEEALVYYERAAALDPGFQEAHHNAGVALHVLGRLEEAKVALERALELEPYDRFTHWTLGEVQIGLGEVEAGVDELEKAARLGADPRLFFDLGRRRASQGRLEEAEEWLGYAVAIERSNPDMHAALGAVVIERGDLARGAGHLGLSLQVREDAVVRSLLARAQWARADWTRALANAERALQSSPERPEVIATLAWMLATSPEDAARDPRRAIELLRPQLPAEASRAAEVDPRLLEAAAAALAVAGEREAADPILAEALTRARLVGLLGVASSTQKELETLRRGGSLVETAATAAARMESGSWSPEGRR